MASRAGVGWFTGTEERMAGEDYYLCMYTTYLGCRYLLWAGGLLSRPRGDLSMDVEELRRAITAPAKLVRGYMYRKQREQH